MFIYLEFFMMILFMVFLLLSSSPSLSMISLLFYSLWMMIFFLNFFFNQFIVFLVMLICVGGLFVLISFVVLFFPKDHDKGLGKGLKVSILFPFFLGLMMIMVILSRTDLMSVENKVNNSFFQSSPSWWSDEVYLSSSMIFSESSTTFIFLIVILLLSLKLVDSLVDLKKSKIFPFSKK